MATLTPCGTQPPPLILPCHSPRLQTPITVPGSATVAGLYIELFDRLPLPPVPDPDSAGTPIDYNQLWDLLAVTPLARPLARAWKSCTNKLPLMTRSSPAPAIRC